MTDGGRVVPDAFVDSLPRIQRLASYIFMSDEMLEDLGFPPRAKGLAYWMERERRAIAAAHPMARLRVRGRRVGWFVRDVPRRLTNARAALAGEWGRNDDD